MKLHIIIITFALSILSYHHRDPILCSPCVRKTVEIAFLAMIYIAKIISYPLVKDSEFHIL